MSYMEMLPKRHIYTNNSFDSIFNRLYTAEIITVVKKNYPN